MGTSKIGTTREVRALAIAATTNLRRTGAGWRVPSQTGTGSYLVNGEHCSCPDHETRGVECKHMLAVEFTIRRESGKGGAYTVTEEVKVTYKQEWSAYNAAQCEEKERFAELLADLCMSISEPPGRNVGVGRPRLPLSLVTFANIYKVYTRLSTRRFMSDLRAVEQRGLISQVPHFNSVIREMATPELTEVLKSLVGVSAMPLRPVESDFAADATGFATSNFRRWFDAKYGVEKDMREFIKLHIMCGVNTNIITAAEVTGYQGADSNSFRPLVAETFDNGFTMNEVSADKAYLSRQNVAYVEKFGATPFIPFKVNSVEPSGDSAWSRMYHRFAMDRQTFMDHYHKRSNVETVFHMMKSKFGDRVLSKCERAQHNEVLCKVIAHNICCVIGAVHELGIDVSGFGQRAG
jgi:transposase